MTRPIVSPIGHEPDEPVAKLSPSVRRATIWRHAHHPKEQLHVPISRLVLAESVG